MKNKTTAQRHKTTVLGFSITGRRDQNEDSFWCRRFPRKSELRAVAAVSDGVGGEVGGKEASSLAVKAVREGIENWTQPTADKADEILTALFSDAQSAITATIEQKPELSGMAATLVVLLLFADSTVIANLGDSRAYHIGQDSVEQVTTDDSALQDALDRKIYTRDEILENPDLRLLTGALLKCLGHDSGDITPELVHCEHEIPEAWLLCSDGLTGGLNKLVEHDELHAQVTSGSSRKSVVRNLVSLAFQKGSTDNITAVLVQNGTFQKAAGIKSEPSARKLLKKELKDQRKFLMPRRLWYILLFSLVFLLTALTITLVVVLINATP